MSEVHTPVVPAREPSVAMCPRCADPENGGLAYSVTEGNGVRLIAYRCPTCEHVWTITTAQENLSVQQGDDPSSTEQPSAHVTTNSRT